MCHHVSDTTTDQMALDKLAPATLQDEPSRPGLQRGQGPTSANRGESNRLARCRMNEVLAGRCSRCSPITTCLTSPQPDVPAQHGMTAPRCKWLLQGPAATFKRGVRVEPLLLPKTVSQSLHMAAATLQAVCAIASLKPRLPRSATALLRRRLCWPPHQPRGSAQGRRHCRAPSPSPRSRAPSPSPHSRVTFPSPGWLPRRQPTPQQIPQPAQQRMMQRPKRLRPPGHDRKCRHCRSHSWLRGWLLRTQILLLAVLASKCSRCASKLRWDCTREHWCQ